MEPQGKLDTRALEIAQDAKTRADLAIDGVSRLDTHIQDLRSENTAQHKDNQNRLESLHDMVTEKFSKLQWAIIGAMGAVILTAAAVLL